jgi:hypothetical protein
MCEILNIIDDPQTSCEVDQFGFVDLNDALASGKLPVSVPASEQSFDAPAGTPLSPSQIGGVPSDIFDAMEMRDAARKSIESAERKTQAKPAASSSAAAEPSASE